MHIFVQISANLCTSHCLLVIKTIRVLWLGCNICCGVFIFLLAKLQNGQPVSLAQTHQRGIDLQPAERRPDWRLCTRSVFPQQKSTLGEPLPCCFHQTASSPCALLPVGNRTCIHSLVMAHLCQWTQSDCSELLSMKSTPWCDYVTYVKCFELHDQQHTNIIMVHFDSVHSCDAPGENTHLHGETKHQVVQFLVYFENISLTEQRYGILGEERD